jgi:hypothetical protein
MDFPRHGPATGVRGLRQQFVQIFCDAFFRVLAAYAALRFFFFTLAFFLVALCESLFSRTTLDLAFCL